MVYDKNIKAIRLLQDRNKIIQTEHEAINDDIASIKSILQNFNISDEEKKIISKNRNKYIEGMSVKKDLSHTSITDIYQESDNKYATLTLSDILSEKDFIDTDNRLNGYILEFNKKYALDGWDYAIAGGCGLFAAMLDVFCVSAPPKPTVKYNEQVDGIFNQYVQKAFNKILPPELSKALSEANKIGSADSSTMRWLINAPLKAMSPVNHRLRELSHDPILGFIFGIRDMLNGTCTTIVDGKLFVINTTKDPINENIINLIIRMFKHLCSDVNAITDNGNRGMGLPAPFMGLLKMFNFNIGDSTFDKQIEYMYVRGYDFRQFVTTSIPVSIMEIMLRVFYIAKQIKLYGLPFGETVIETMPFKLNPRFRIMLALAYGTLSSINAGKIYITKNIMNANYAAWVGFAWNLFHSLKWSLWGKYSKLWDEIEQKEIDSIKDYIKKIESLEMRAITLPF